MSKKMDNHNLISSNELLKAQSHIWNHIFNFVNSASLKCAVQMRIPDIIHAHGKPMSLSSLLAALHVHCSKLQHLSRLMRVLTHSGFFAMSRISEDNNDDDDCEEGYVLSPTSYYLLSDHPMTMVPFLLAVLDPALLKPWKYVQDWFKNDDQSPFETANNGRSLWEQAAIDPQLNEFFNKGMSSDARLVASVVLDECRGIFEGLSSLVDVGGGTGTMVYCISKAFPDMKCINFDLPHVVAGLESSVNLTHVEGDMFQSIPQANATLLKSIMHDWSEEECVKILTNCREAIAKENGGNGGKVIIIDMVVSSKDKAVDIEVAETQLLFDMVMMTLVTGRERTEKEWADLFEKSGFKTYKITHVLGLRFFKHKRQMDLIKAVAKDSLREALLDDQQQSTESGQQNPENPTKTPAIRAVRKTFKNAANLSKLLPTGTVLVFQYLSPILTNEGKCPTPRNKICTIGLLALCSLSCVILSFTDSIRDPKGKVRYGLATFRGLWIIDGSMELPVQESTNYRVKFLDFLHSVLTVLVFAAVALFDRNVVSCFYKVSEEDVTELLIGLPAAIGLACSLLFVLFPSKRHGVGSPLSRQ